MFEKKIRMKIKDVSQLGQSSLFLSDSTGVVLFYQWFNREGSHHIDSRRTQKMAKIGEVAQRREGTLFWANIPAGVKKWKEKNKTVWG